MQKTLLETNAEDYLPTIDRELGDRIYAPSLDFKADMELAMQRSNSAKQGFISDMEPMSFEQTCIGQQSLLVRRSQILNGLGFIYRIDPSKYDRLFSIIPIDELADNIIRNRDFGKAGSEALEVWYNRDAEWQESAERDFYSDDENQRLIVHGIEDKRIIVTNLARERGNFEGAQFIRGMLDTVEQDLDGNLLDEESIRILMNHLKELAEIVDGKPYTAS